MYVVYFILLCLFGYGLYRLRAEYLKRLLVAVDQFLNVILWGYEDETLSSRAYRLSVENLYWYSKIPMKIIDTLLFFDTTVIGGRKVKHCEKAYYHEKERRDLPPELRGEVWQEKIVKTEG